jgi:hypothetical protein
MTLLMINYITTRPKGEWWISGSLTVRDPGRFEVVLDAAKLQDG